MAKYRIYRLHGTNSAVHSGACCFSVNNHPYRIEFDKNGEAFIDSDEAAEWFDNHNTNGVSREPDRVVYFVDRLE